MEYLQWLLLTYLYILGKIVYMLPQHNGHQDEVQLWDVCVFGEKPLQGGEAWYVTHLCVYLTVSRMASITQVKPYR